MSKTALLLVVLAGAMLADALKECLEYGECEWYKGMPGNNVRNLKIWLHNSHSRASARVKCSEACFKEPKCVAFEMTKNPPASGGKNYHHCFLKTKKKGEVPLNYNNNNEICNCYKEYRDK